MATPRNPEKARHSTALRLPVDLLEALDAECEKRVIGRNRLVEHLIRDGLTRLPPVSLSRGDDAGAHDATQEESGE